MSTVRISYGCPVRSTCPGNPQVWDAQPKSGAAGNGQAKAQVQKAVGSYCGKQKFKTTHHPPSSKEGQKNPLQFVRNKIVAIETVKIIARNHAPSEVMIERQDGTIQLRYTYTSEQAAF